MVRLNLVQGKHLRCHVPLSRKSGRYLSHGRAQFCHKPTSRRLALLASAIYVYGMPGVVAKPVTPSRVRSPSTNSENHARSAWCASPQAVSDSGNQPAATFSREEAACSAAPELKRIPHTRVRAKKLAQSYARVLLLRPAPHTVWSSCVDLF
eukprot:233154-Pleurochrysis_carterae.AAC.2